MAFRQFQWDWNKRYFWWNKRSLTRVFVEKQGAFPKCEATGKHELLADVLVNGKRTLFFFLQRDHGFQRMDFRTVQISAYRLCRFFRDRPALGCGNIAKDELGQLFFLAVPPEFGGRLKKLRSWPATERIMY